MKFKFIKTKAVFQIFIIICAILTIYLAKPVEAQQNACCERTIDGNYCVYTNVANCDSNYNAASTSCEQTQYCQVGCCYDVKEGQCHKNVPLALCKSVESATWDPNADCDIYQCQKGCCVLGETECSFITQTRCKKVTAEYNLEMDFRSMNSELECIDICRAAEEGCCVARDGTCKFSTREDCNAVGGEFNLDTYCSDPSLDCDCTAHHHKGCLDDKDDVFWFDSCDNREEVAEDCDYAEKDTLCGQDEDGNYVCKSTNCLETYKDPHTPYTGVPRKNGESWCVYDGRVGYGQDLVGSRHYRHICINGEEKTESCKDYREEFCIQATVINTPKGDYNEATCRESRWQGCIDECNEDQQCCENENLGDCVWSGSKCIPLVPPGFKFWPGKSSRRTSKYSGSNYCDEGDTSCTVFWVKEDWHSDWECKQNCECLEDSWVTSTNAYCRSLGDCGAHYNIAGKFTTDGFSENSPGNLDMGLIGSFEDWKNAGEGLNVGQVDAEKVGGFMSAFQEHGMLLAASLGVLSAATHFGVTGAGIGVFEGGFAALGGFFGIGTEVAGIEGVVAAMETASTAGVGTVSPPGAAFAVIGMVLVIVTVIMIIFSFGGDSRSETYYVDCEPWVAPAGGEDCGKCTEDKFKECTEYRCRSLGQACELINEGTDRVACVDLNPNDVNSPRITPWSDILTVGYSIRELQYGYEIIPQIEPFTPITFGIKTDEFAQCKITTEHTSSYDAMPSTFFGDSLYTKEHNITLSLPNGKSYTYFIRCQDAHKNSNVAEYAIRFSTKPGPDLTPPVIETTSIANNALLPYGTNETLLTLYLNEPAECKWDKEDTGFEFMENNFICNFEVNEDLYNLYECLTVLTNLKNNQENVFYFRCKDQPLEIDETKRNTMEQSYAFTLIGTSPLMITYTAPQGDLYYNNPTLQVQTSMGAENGKAKCKFSTTETSFANMIEFFNTDSTQHSQQLEDLGKGSYVYYVKCQDKAGNEASSVISFTVTADTIPPKLIYIYEDSIALHIALDEESTCEYASSPFYFGDGTRMTGTNTKEHAAPLQDVYYVICQDVYENEMPMVIIYS